jgi:GNAT superfamily N-acetyltransferase
VAGEPTIRRAQAADEPRMREIAAAAKGHWGYDAERVRSWAGSLELAGLEEAWVAEEQRGVVAWTAILPGPSVCILEHLWVDPKLMGRGLGAALFERAVERARELGGNWLQWESEPNATGFYEKLGGVQVGATLGSWGRELPVMQLDLTG